MSPLKGRSFQRLSLSIFGIVIIQVTWRWAVAHLYSLPEHSIAAFSSITNNTNYVVGAIVVFMVTGRLITDLKGSGVINFFRRNSSNDIPDKRIDPKDVDTDD